MAHSETSQTASNWDKNHLEELEPCPFPSHTPNVETIKAMETEKEEEYDDWLRARLADTIQKLDSGEMKTSSMAEVQASLQTKRAARRAARLTAVQQVQGKPENALENIAGIYMTDPAFTQCREDEKLWENTIDVLIEKITPENLPDEADIDWGKPRGSEVW